MFTEVVIAPDATAEAKAIFAGKKNLRLLTAGGLPDPRAPGVVVRYNWHAVQSRDNGCIGAADLKVVTKRAPTERELATCCLPSRWRTHRSAIVYVKDGAAASDGPDEPHQFRARIAGLKAADAAAATGAKEPLARGAVVGSDAFFPFPDGVEEAAAAGATAVIQPGGSKGDADVIAAADKAGIAMVFTGMRHFRH